MHPLPPVSSGNGRVLAAAGVVARVSRVPGLPAGAAVRVGSARWQPVVGIRGAVTWPLVAGVVARQVVARVRQGVLRRPVTGIARAVAQLAVAGVALMVIRLPVAAIGRGVPGRVVTGVVVPTGGCGIPVMTGAIAGRPS